MPNPKRRHSNTRTRKRRTHDVMTAAQTTFCPTCLTRDKRTPLRRHRACVVCGYYRGRAVLQIKTKEKKKKA